jgi:hypothetical protein
MNTLTARKTMPQTAPVDDFGDRQSVFPAKSGGMTDLQSRRLKQVQNHYPCREKLFKRIYARQASPRECIKGFCLECNGWDETAIRDCSATACPIYAQRPFQVAESEDVIP